MAFILPPERDFHIPDLARPRWLPPGVGGATNDPTAFPDPGDGFWPDLYRALWDSWGDPYWWPGRNGWECAVGAVLVQNTTWKNAGRMVDTLHDRGWGDPRTLLDAPLPELEETMRPVGYYRMKSRKVKGLAGWWMANRVEDGGVNALSDSDLRASLLAVWGIGPETADDILVYSFGRPWFVVDAYAHRLRERLTGDPERLSYDQLQAEVHAQVTRDPLVMNHLHGMVVNLCKFVCRAKPACDLCPLRFGCAFAMSR